MSSDVMIQGSLRTTTYTSMNTSRRIDTIKAYNKDIPVIVTEEKMVESKINLTRSPIAGAWILAAFAITPYILLTSEVRK